MKRHLPATVAAFVAALAGTVLVVEPVAAECPYLPPWPPITTAIPTAQEIVVGEVVTDFAAADLDLPANQQLPDYALRVTHVLRGDARPGDVLDVQYLLPNWPQVKVAGVSGTLVSCTYLRAAPGEVIALAYGALQPGGRMTSGDVTWSQPPTRYQAVGVIHADAGRSDDYPWSEREMVTLAQLQHLASLPQTDALEATRDRPGQVALLIVATIGGLLLGLRRFRDPGRTSR